MVDKPIQIQESWECQFLIFPINFLSKLSFNSQFLSKLSPLFYPTKIFQTKVLEEHNLELKNVPFKWKIFSLKKPTHYPVLFSILSQLGKNFIVDFHVSIDRGFPRIHRPWFGNCWIKVPRFLQAKETNLMLLPSCISISRLIGSSYTNTEFLSR